MPSLEERLQERYPDWFRGRRAQVTRPLLHGVARWSRLADIEAFIAREGHRQGFDFLDATLDFLGLRYAVDAGELASIPAQGRLLIAANHPSGALDALALLHAVGRVRRDVKIVANEMLSLLAPMASLMLPVRVLGGRADPRSLRAIDAALDAEQCVIVFPAGEVSRLGPRGVRDRRWMRGFIGFARRTGAPVLPVRIVARNSALFYGTSALFKPAATALLAREMFARRDRPVRLHVGQRMRIDVDTDPVRALNEVRRRVYALGRDQPPLARCEPLASPVAPGILRADIRRTHLLGETGDGKQIRLAQLQANDPLMLEIGRLRELTFRQVGEGAGLARDLDAFDPHYQHIVVWDNAAARIAGAYRIARGAQVLARQGLAGLYTASLFRYADDAIPRLAQGLELGRSFVHPEYWGSRSLDYLWQGIGAYLACHPGVRYLFGAVSISAALPVAARDQIVAYYSRYYGAQTEADRDALAHSLRPFRYFAAPPCFGALDSQTAFDVLRSNLATLGATVPILYRQYTELCEPGGVRFLAFGVDPAFSDSIDGLIEIDLQRLLPRKRKRYLRASEVTA